MKNLLSKLFNSSEIKIGERLNLYIPALKMNSNLKKEKFVILDGIKGMFKIEDIYRFVNSAEYKIQLIRENYPKNYAEDIERIENYSTKEH